MSGKTKGVTTALMLFAVSSVNAGFYAGAGLGSDTVDFTSRSRVIQPNPGHPEGFDVINKGHLSATGWFGTLVAGFGTLVHNNFYLGAEVNGNISSTASTSFNHEYIHNNFTDTVTKIKNSIGVSALPGYQLLPATLLYGRVGLTNSKIEVKTGDISLQNFDKRRNGFRYGLGIKQALTERLALRMDYSRISYASIQSSTFDPVGGVAKANTLTPNQQLIEFSLIYNFA